MAKKILYAEDDREMRHLVAQILRYEGYEIIETGNGAECLEIARREHPDLYLLDLILPGMGGAEVMRQLKTMPDTMNAPVIIITAHNVSPRNLEEWRCEGFLQKPFDSFTLIALVRKLCQPAANRLKA